MCMVIYAALFALLFIYSDHVIKQYALSVSAGEQQWMVAAIGWEMLAYIWPVILMLMLLASGVTLLWVRLRTNRTVDR